MEPQVARKLAVGHLCVYWWFQVLIISKCMVYMHAVFAAFYIYAHRDEDIAKTRGWGLCIK